MKIEYKKEGGSGYATLLDESAGDVLTGYDPTFRPLTERAPMFDADSEKPLNLGNVRTSLPLEWTATYADADAAVAAVTAFALDLLDSVLSVRLTVVSGVYYFENALVETLRARLSGVTVTYSADLTAGPVSAASAAPP